MLFKKWFESINQRKSLLILIHPECCAELGPESATKYEIALKQFAPNFDYIITHAFTSSNDWLAKSSLPEDYKQAWGNLRNTAESISTKFLFNPKDMYGCSYDSELPDYLIENPETDIYMAGGYESNCLWIAYKRLFEKLNWLIKENNTKVSYFKPLIFAIREKGGINPSPYPSKKFDSWEKTWGDFHPEKVDYTK